MSAEAPVPVSGPPRACVVVAEFEVRARAFDAFDALARRFAAQCLDREPGCRRFDVVTLESPARGMLFHEVYDDEAAFERHCRSPHLADFRVAFAPLIVAERALRKGTR